MADGGVALGAPGKVLVRGEAKDPPEVNPPVVSDDLAADETPPRP
jgi:hypothetical protein